MNSILYSIGDKGIYDAILQGVITKDHLEEIFLSRGIIISHKTDRTTLAQYFSRFPHSYDDFLRFSYILSSSSQREKLTFLNLTTSLEINDLDDSIDSFVKYLHDSHDASCSYKKESENKYAITVSYNVYNFNRSEFRQVTHKDAKIEIEIGKDDSLLVRHPNNKNVCGYVDKLISEVESNSGDSFEVNRISLQDYSDPKLRTKFLENLINNIKGFYLYDVIDVYVYHPKENGDVNLSEDDDVFEETEVTMTGTHISKASLKGEGVLQSDEINQLYDKNFYLYRVVWQSKIKDLVGSDVYEFEATFTNPEKMTDFSYLIKGFYRYKGTDEYTKSRMQPDKQDSDWLNGVIEESAHASMSHIESLQNDNSKK